MFQDVFLSASVVEIASRISCVGLFDVSIGVYERTDSTMMMGLAATHARILGLHSKKIELEFTLEQIAQSQQSLANEQLNLINISSTFEPESAEARRLQQKLLYVQAQDKFYSLQSARSQNQHNMVQTELETLKKIQEKAVENVFKPFS